MHFQNLQYQVPLWQREMQQAVKNQPNKQTVQVIATICNPIDNLLPTSPFDASSLIAEKQQADFSFMRGQAKKQVYKYKSEKVSNLMHKIQVICDRYFINLFKKDFERIVAKVQRMNEAEGLVKFSSESAAVVIVYEYKDQIRMRTTKEFCSMNGLSTCVFNRKYKVYYNLFVKQKLGEEFQPLMAETTEEYYPELPDKFLPDFPQVATPTEAISVIYDLLFKTDFFQLNRRRIIEKVMEHYEGLDRRLFRQLEYIADPTSRIYFIVYHILKAMKAGLQFKDYVKAVRRKTGSQLDHKGRQDTEISFLTYFGKNMPCPTIFEVQIDPQILTDV